jgi:thiol-disulfide isomerase/thioredoxin
MILLVLTATYAFNQQNKMTERGNPKETVTVDGVEIPVYDFDGFSPMLKANDASTYVVNFWATWCKPCVEEMPHFLKLSEEMEGQNVEFLFVSLDFRKNLEKGVVNFVREHGMEGKTVMLSDPDANSWISQVDPSWSGAIPATLIFNRDKKEFHEAQLSYEELKSIINSFVKL